MSIKSLLKQVLPQSLVDAYGRAKNLRLVRGPLTYADGVVASRQNCDFVKDERFLRAYQIGEATAGWGVLELHWRMHVACSLAFHASRLDGDFVECGVNRGAMAHDEKAKGLGTRFYGESFEAVTQLFAYLGDKVVIVRGPVPDTLPQVDTDLVAFISIDMNCVNPEIAAAEFFWDKLVQGGVMLLDDYGWPTHEIQKQAFDVFARERGVEVLSLPTGQGIILKS